MLSIFLTHFECLCINLSWICDIIENMYFKIWETMHRIHYVSSITIARIMFNCYCNWRIFSLLIEKLPTSFVSKFFPTLIKTGSNQTKNTFLLQIWILSFFFLWTLRKYFLNTKIFCLFWKIFYIEVCFRFCLPFKRWREKRRMSWWTGMKVKNNI